MDFNPNVIKIATYPSAELDRKKRELLAQGRAVYDFGVGDPIEPTPDFIRQALIAGIPEVSQYPPVRGIPALRNAIRDYVDRRFKVKLDPETQILPSTGSKEAIYNLAFLFSGANPKKNLIIGPAPGYFVMDRSALIAGIEYYPFRLGDDNQYLMELSSLTPEILERAAVVWINYPHNPTGKDCDLNYLKRQVTIAKQYDILLCSDECYVDIYFGDKAPPSVLELTTEGVVAFHSCSKRSGMTAYRSGFMAGDARVLKLFGDFRNTVGVAAPVYTQAAATAAWSDDAHVAERRLVFAKKRQVFLDFFKAHNIEYVPSDATFYFWVKAPGGMTGSAYTLRLLEQGLVVSPGDSFSPYTPHHFRIATVPSLDDCNRALESWAKIL